MRTLYEAILESLPPAIQEKIVRSPFLLATANMIGLDQIINKLGGPDTIQTIRLLARDVEAEGPLWQQLRQDHILPFLRNLSARLEGPQYPDA